MYITTTTQLCQLYKIPVFISHFIEHNQGGDFLEEMETFLVHHYGGHEVDDDWETDQKLPFMKIELLHIDFYFSPTKKLIAQYTERTVPTNKIVFFNESVGYSHYLNTIWQPPKQA